MNKRLLNLLLCLFLASFWASAQQNNLDTGAYYNPTGEEPLQSNPADEVVAFPFDVLDTSLVTFQVLDSIAGSSRFIFTGEDHRVERFNTLLELKLMQYLHTKGYRYYVMEAGWISAWIINQYILLADTSAEKVVKNYYSTNYYELFKGIKEINDRVPYKEKIKVVGLDVERDAALSLKTLELWLPNKPTPDSLELFVETLRILSGIQEEEAKSRRTNESSKEDPYVFGGSYGNYNYGEEDEDFEAPNFYYFDLTNSVEELTKLFRRKESEFKIYLGSNYQNFERAIKEIENALLWLSYESKEMAQSWVFREHYMEMNFKSAFKDLPEAKGYGQFGRCHVHRSSRVTDCGFAFFSSLNRRIATKIPELKDKITSIGIFYSGLGDEEVKENGNINDLMDVLDYSSAGFFIDLADYADDKLTSKFTSIIVVKNNGTTDVDYSEEEEEEYPYESTNEKPSSTGFGLDVNYVQRTYDMKPFIAATGFEHTGGINNFEFGFTSTYKRFRTVTAVGLFQANEQFRSNGIAQRLSGFNLRYALGADLIKAKWLDIVPEIGIGYSNFTFSEESTLPIPNSFGASYYTEYRNPAFILDARLNASILIRKIEFRGFVGYNHDSSSHYWRQNDRLVSSGPKTNFSGMYTGFGMSIRLK